MKGSWSTEGEAGFTLLETMAVLLLVVLLASLVFPHFDLVYSRWQEKTALLQILRDLKEAESEAAGRGREMRLVFLAGKPYYQLELGGTVLRRPLPGLTLAGEEEAGDEKTVIKFGAETPEEQAVVLLGAKGRVYRVLAAKGRPPEVFVNGEGG
ncbi:MAG: hypothetical protein GX894_06030 [Clostridia bacterium]|nr:hypothetical protein [Clostridia bacterium]